MVTSCCSCAKGDPLLMMSLTISISVLLRLRVLLEATLESTVGDVTLTRPQGYGLKVIMNVIMVINIIITVIQTFPNCDLKVTCPLLRTAVSAIRPIMMEEGGWYCGVLATG